MMDTNLFSNGLWAMFLLGAGMIPFALILGSIITEVIEPLFENRSKK